MTDYARPIYIDLHVAWDLADYTQEGSRVISAAGQVRLAPPESAIFSPRGTADRCTITLDNSDGRYSSLLTSGALYADLAGGGAYHAPMYLTVNVVDGAPANYHRVFTGVVKIPTEQTPTGSQPATVTLDCRSRDELLLSKRISTTQAAFAAWVDSPPNEAELIAAFLVAAGLTSADYTLDAGLFAIPYPWLDNESPIEACWSLAAACGGRFYVDQDGIFRYENYTHWLTSPHNTSQHTVTRSAYAGFAPYYEDRELYTGVTVQATPYSIAGETTVWEARTVYIVPPNTTGSDYVTVTAELSGPAYALSAPAYAAVTSGGSNLSGSVTCTATNYAQRVVMQFQNSHATQAALITGLALVGRLVEADESVTVDLDSANAFWTGRAGRTRALTGNRWLQTQPQATVLAEFLRDRHEAPRLFFNVTDYRGGPERRLGDRITLNDSEIMSAGRDAFILAIDWSFGGGRFKQNLVCLDSTDLFEFADTTPGYFVVGVNKLGAADALRGHVFY